MLDLCAEACKNIEWQLCESSSMVVSDSVSISKSAIYHALLVPSMHASYDLLDEPFN